MLVMFEINKINNEITLDFIFCIRINDAKTYNFPVSDKIGDEIIIYNSLVIELVNNIGKKILF